jgi:hypothetical protein
MTTLCSLGESTIYKGLVLFAYYEKYRSYFVHHGSYFSIMEKRTGNCEIDKL